MEVKTYVEVRTDTDIQERLTKAFYEEKLKHKKPYAWLLGGREYLELCASLSRLPFQRSAQFVETPEFLGLPILISPSGTIGFAYSTKDAAMLCYDKEKAGE